MSVVIIGGGASGCFSAVQCAGMGKKVILIEKNNRLGKKLRITGKGRCNLTNNCDTDTLMKNIPRNGRFLYSAFASFNSQDIMNYFENLGVKLKTERGNRVFPMSDQANEIAETLASEMRRLNVEILHDTATEIMVENGVCCGVRCGNREILADSVILCAGGSTYPATGSEGDGYRLAQKAGHTITLLKPSLVPLETLERDCAEMMGISLKNVTLTLKRDGKPLYSELGEMLFTHFGVSGPLVLSASAHMEGEGTFTLHIDMKPALTSEQLDQRIQREIAGALNKELPSLLRKLVPSNMVMPLIGRCGINPHTKANSLTKTNRLKLVKELKDFAFTVRGTRPMEEGIITRGGVCCKEVNPKTMESKLIPKLYFAGEVLDCDAYTGGFNLQIAWSTAYLSAVNCQG
ncbi:MAG: NAD(P)/FAD-dependent oxidoreductase [Oscillospiraceae bacterium]